MGRRTITSTCLSHVTAASYIADAVQSERTTPVILHWQLAEFPLRIARRLLQQGRDLLWVVATTERADIVQQKLSEAGIAVRTIRPPESHVEDPSQSRIERYRAKKKRTEALRESRYPQPDPGTITVVQINQITHARPLGDVAAWVNPVAIFDHIGVLQARWMEAVFDEDVSEDSMQYTVTIRDSDTHPISVLRSAGVPVVFVARDELEVELHRQYFTVHGTHPNVGTTVAAKSPKLKISVVGTNLVWSRHAAGAFLSVLACNPHASIVGEALIGGITPDRLSMTTIAPLKKAVLKISHLASAIVDLDERQTRLSAAEVRAMRARDFVRTTTLAIDPGAHSPELVIFCPSEMAAAVATHVDVKCEHLGSWKPSGSRSQVKGSSFFQKVVGDAVCYPEKLRHASRLPRIAAAFDSEEKRLPKKFARLTLAVHSAAAKGKEWDLAARPEDLLGESDRLDAHVELFNLLFDTAFPWSVKALGSTKAALQGRQEAIAHYRKLRAWLPEN